jgi:phosphatidylglycerol:prolipoprotein diacylglycerol transferase
VWPHHLTLGPISISSYGLVVGLGALAGLILLRYTAPLAGTTKSQALELSFWLIVFGLIGSRTAYVLTHLSDFSGRKLDVLMYWRGGLMFHGGLLAGLLFTSILALKGQIRLLVMADAIFPSLALGQAIGRLGCLLAGCCFGLPAPSSFPLRLIFPSGSLAPSAIALYPTQLMESIGLFLTTALLLVLLKRPQRPQGLISALYLTLAGALRFYIDFYRGDFRGPRVLGLPPTSWTAVLLFAAGCIALAFLFFRRKPSPPKPVSQNPTQNPTHKPTPA